MLCVTESHVYSTFLYDLLKLLQYKVRTVILVRNIAQWFVILFVLFKLHYKNHYSLTVLIVSCKYNEHI